MRLKAVLIHHRAARPSPSPRHARLVESKEPITPAYIDTRQQWGYDQGMCCEATLEDILWVSGQDVPVEEALVTWMEASVSGSTARIVGERHELELAIEAPAGAEFRLAVLEEESRANAKSVPLKPRQ